MPQSTQTILFADDEPWYNQGLKEEFEEAGFRVTWTTTGDDALETLESGVSIDLIILDLMMPPGKRLTARLGGRRTGMAICEYVRRTLRLKVPIIFLTVVEDKDVHREIARLEREAGMDSTILVKPVAPQDLVLAAMELLGTRSI